MTKRDYRDYLQDIVNAIEDVASFTKDMSYRDFLTDQKTKNAVIRSFEIIGEATKNLPDSIRKMDASIPWKRMAGMRDKIIHEYFGVDYQIVWKTAKRTLPKLRTRIADILETENAANRQA